MKIGYLEAESPDYDIGMLVYMPMGSPLIFGDSLGKSIELLWVLG